MCLQYKFFEVTMGKGEIAPNKQFLLFPQCFLPFWRTFCYFRQIQNSHLQTLSVWKNLKFVVLEKIKPFPKQHNSDSSKLKGLADDNFKFDENGKAFSKRVENTVGKGEIAP